MMFCVKKAEMEESIRSRYLQTALVLLDLDKNLSTVPVRAGFWTDFCADHTGLTSFGTTC